MKTLKPWTIYIWNYGEIVYAASPVVTRDGIKEIYKCAWTTSASQNDPNAEQLTEKKKLFRAKSFCKKQLSGTLNIIDWFGKKALDGNGNIDTSKLNELFATQAVRAEMYNKYPEDLWPEKKFPTKEITLEEAIEYQLA